MKTRDNKWYFDKCPHKNKELYEKENGQLTNRKDCTNCGHFFKPIDINDVNIS